MKQLCKPVRLAGWKQWLILLCVFTLGVLVGRLLLDRWQLVAGIIAVSLLLLALLLGNRKG